jgi:hypothetical protein
MFLKLHSCQNSAAAWRVRRPSPTWCLRSGCATTARSSALSSLGMICRTQESVGACIRESGIFSLVSLRQAFRRHFRAFGRHSTTSGGNTSALTFTSVASSGYFGRAGLSVTAPFTFRPGSSQDFGFERMDVWPDHALQRIRRERPRSSRRDPDVVYRGCHRCVPACRAVALGEGGCAGSLLGRAVARV